jgi:hypothetical protein
MTTIRSKACKSSVSGDDLCITAAAHPDRRSTSYCEFITGQRFIASVVHTVLQPISISITGGGGVYDVDDQQWRSSHGTSVVRDNNVGKMENQSKNFNTAILL